MIDLDLLNQALDITQSRYALCVLLGKRAKQINLRQRRPAIGLGSLVRQAIDDIVNRSFVFTLPSGEFDKQRLLPERKTRLLLAEKASSLSEYAMLSLYALAKANLEDDRQAIVDESYSIQAGVSSSLVSGFVAEPFNITVAPRMERIPFDFLIHLVGQIKLVGDCQRRLYYDPMNTSPQLVDFEFTVLDTGSNLVSVDCYHDRRWLRTFEFTFKSVRIRMKAVA